ncbi:hypothetical protein HEP86_32270 [Streptomyces sp. RPA4-5]|nr:hypothetical protein HEP86_32270 [Streptomyces sp. RPA4-5]
MADSAEIVEPTSPTSGAAGPGGSARSAGPDRPAVALRRTRRTDRARADHPNRDAGPSGITHQRMPVPVLGFVLTVAMPLIMDWPGTPVGLLLRPRGLEVD